MFYVKSLRRAKSQTRKIFLYYNQIDFKISLDFQNCLNSSVRQITQTPQAFPVYFDNNRKKLMDKFPYGIFYKIEGNVIFITAVLHMAQDNLTGKLQ